MAVTPTPRGTIGPSSLGQTVIDTNYWLETRRYKTKCIFFLAPTSNYPIYQEKWAAQTRNNLNGPIDPQITSMDWSSWLSTIRLVLGITKYSSKNMILKRGEKGHFWISSKEFKEISPRKLRFSHHLWTRCQSVVPIIQLSPEGEVKSGWYLPCLLYTSPSPRDA